MKQSICVLALVIGAAGCGTESDATETRASVQALVTAEGGVPGGEEQFVVEVVHDDNVPSEEARRLAANIRVRKITPRADGLVLAPRVIRPVDTHWLLPDDHDVGVQVLPANDNVDRDDYQWEWVDEAMVFPHCPEGDHGFNF